MIRYAGLCLILVGVLASCSVPLPDAPTVEAAVYTWIQNVRSSRARSLPDIKASQALPGGAVALVAYDAEQNGQLVKMTSLLFFKHTLSGWANSGGGSIARSPTDPLPSVQIVSAPDSQGRNGAAGGFVSDPAVAQVAVTFEDGSRVIVPVENGVYLAVQSGVQTIQKVEALDSQATVLYQERR